MAVRNCAEIGENLQKIARRLMANDDLINLLYYTDTDPLSHNKLDHSQKEHEIFEKQIKIIPKILAQDVAKPIISIQVMNGRRDFQNDEFRNVGLEIGIFVPLTQWFIKGTNLRTFAIMGEIQKSLDGVMVNGLGKLNGGDFEFKFATEDVSCYAQSFEVITYD